MNYITNIVVLPRTVYGHPSGVYDGSSSDFYSRPVKAVNYYRGQGHTQVVWVNVTDFQGVIRIQANLDSAPGVIDSRITEDDIEVVTYEVSKSWFDVAEFDSASSIITDHRPLVILGNFTWIRAYITGFEAGTINLININY